MVHGALVVLGLALAVACSASGDACPSGQAPLTVVSTEVAAHYVRLDLQYSGGCAEHDFAVWWPDGIVAPSAPPQVQLHLQHYDRGDACEALVARSIWVDLSPLHEVQLGTDRFLIQIRGHPGSIDYTFAAAAPPPSEDVVAIDQSCGAPSSR